MKSVLYLLIAVFVFGIIAASIPSTPKSTKVITIQSSENTISQADLAKSANIISARLKSFSPEKFDLQVISEKNQIQLNLSDKWDANFAAKLLIHKGKLGFYGTYNQKELSALLGVNNQIFNLFNSNSSNTQIGCTDIKGTDKVIEYLKSLAPIQDCSFAWGQVSKKSEVCLYALKTSKDHDAMISGDDIETVSQEKGKSPDQYEINLKFKALSEKKWADATRQNIDHAIAIVLDGAVICAPIVKSEINGGLCIISGNFSKDEASSFAAILQNGELPLDFKIVK